MLMLEKKNGLKYLSFHFKKLKKEQLYNKSKEKEIKRQK